MSESNIKQAASLSPVVQEIKSVLDCARQNVAVQVNNELLLSYWKIGEIIIRYEQDNGIVQHMESKRSSRCPRHLLKR